MSSIRRMRVEAQGGQDREIEVVPETETIWTGIRLLAVKGDQRTMKLTGEIWTGGPVYGSVLVERVSIVHGRTKTTYAVAKWLP